MNQKQLLMYIDQVSFAIDDLILFLDTHPCDREALECYHKLVAMREEAMKKYTCEYGPLEVTQIQSDCRWEWVDAPWPWE